MKLPRCSSALLWIGCFAALAAGCGPVGTPSELKNEPIRAPGETTLYDELGGGQAIYAITDSFVDRAMADPRVNFQREGHPHAWDPTPQAIGRLKLYWAQYIDMLADGPQVYEGGNINTAHHGMDISEGEWLALLDDLKQTLDAYRIAPAIEKSLMTRVAATHDAVVGR